MITVAPLQLSRLLKLFIGLLLGLLVLWSGCGLLTIGDVVMPRDLPIRLLFLGLVVVIAAGLAWVVYKNYYHTVLLYDADSFRLKRGRNQIGGQWREFSDVSLVHIGSGQFVVRLYRDRDRFEEIPVSTLKLDPSEFRFLAMKYVRS